MARLGMTSKSINIKSCMIGNPLLDSSKELSHELTMCPGSDSQFSKSWGGK